MPRFSANLGFLWAEHPLLDRIDMAAKAGFKAIELHWPYDVPAEAARAACERNGLKLLGLNTALGDTAKGESGLGAVPGREDGFQAAVDQSIAYCLASGANAIHTLAGIVPPWRMAEATATFTRNLALAADKAAAHGLMLLLEPINQRDKPGYFYSTTARAVEMISRVGRDNIRIMFDIYHVGSSEGDVLRRLEKHFPLIGHVQIAAVPSRAEPDEGEIAYAAIFEALDVLGYNGYVGCEYKPRRGVEEGLGWLKTLGVSL